jgi:hypothetical protein
VVRSGKRSSEKRRGVSLLPSKAIAFQTDEPPQKEEKKCSNAVVPLKCSDAWYLSPFYPTKHAATSAPCRMWNPQRPSTNQPPRFLWK